MVGYLPTMNDRSRSTAAAKLAGIAEDGASPLRRSLLGTACGKARRLPKAPSPNGGFMPMPTTSLTQQPFVGECVGGSF
jgi:hypothetical protein